MSSEKIEKCINIPSWCASIDQVLYIESKADELQVPVSQVFRMIVNELINKYGEIK